MDTLFCPTARILSYKSLSKHIVELTSDQADLLACGNSSVVLTSTVLRAFSNIASLCSMKYAAIRPSASSLTVSFHAAFAAFSERAALSKLAICKSCNVVREKSNNNSGIGKSLIGWASGLLRGQVVVLALMSSV